MVRLPEVYGCYSFAVRHSSPGRSLAGGPFASGSTFPMGLNNAEALIKLGEA